MADALGLQQIRDELRKLNTDVYFGSGKDNPSITTRLSLMEDCVNKMSRNLSRIVWLLVATFITTAADLVVKASK